MEWSPDGVFEDRASLLFRNRRLPTPDYKLSRTSNTIEIETTELTIRFWLESGAFGPDNLEVELSVLGNRVVWKPGSPDVGNLGGTIRALDGLVGPVDLGSGLLSRDGWVVIDDSERPLFDGKDPLSVAKRPSGERIDWYFLGYGHDYVQTLADFARVAGGIPMPPRFAFGYWFSRYWAYTDRDLMNLVEDFEERNLPLDVLVIDMDWHETLSEEWGRERPRDQAGEWVGWTGYTWNDDNFPDPAGFLRWTERHGLRTPLNIHPASGIHPHEESYDPMARAMGIDPATREYVPFEIEDRRFVEAFFEHVIHPLERMGVDFWWLDWLPKDALSIPGLDPTWWVNHVFFNDMEKQGQRRPLIMHRYGGLGNHRYPIGFSGDTHSSWEVLSFLPKFTATASNVMFGYWSHDIGGHLGGNLDPELYTRWVQFGAFSPIFRTHVTKLSEARRAFWEYPHEFEEAMRKAIELRLELVPYFYAAARLAYETGVSIVRPMYYAYPEREEAYEFDGQYMLGADLVVSPVAHPREVGSRVAVQRVWLPPGQWFEWTSGVLHTGDRIVEREYRLDEIPLFVRAGAILPLQRSDHQAAVITEPIVLAVFPGGDRSSRFYEDDSVTNGYRRDEFAWTVVQKRTIGAELQIEIGPTDGTYPGMRDRVRYEIRLVGVVPPQRVQWNGEALLHRPDRGSPGWWFDGQRLETVIGLPESSRQQTHLIQASSDPGDEPHLLDGVQGSILKLIDAREILDQLTPKRGAPQGLIRAIQTGRRIELAPSSARQELAQLEVLSSQLIAEIQSLPVDRDLVNQALAALGEQPLAPTPKSKRPVLSRRRLLAIALIFAMAISAALYGRYRSQ